MPKRTEKFRGSRTHGRGMKAGRGAGMRGGKGNAGLHKHKYISCVKYMPDHFGRHGFKRPQKLAKAKITINVQDICEKADFLIENGLATKEGGALVVDLGGIGIDKLLGKGKATMKLKITVSEATPRAVAKVQEAGGEVVGKDGSAFEAETGDDEEWTVIEADDENED